MGSLQPCTIVTLLLGQLPPPWSSEWVESELQKLLVAKAINKRWVPSTSAKTFILTLGYLGRVLWLSFADFILLCLKLHLSIILFNLDAVTIR